MNKNEHMARPEDDNIHKLPKETKHSEGQKNQVIEAIETEKKINQTVRKESAISQVDAQDVHRLLSDALRSALVRNPEAERIKEITMSNFHIQQKPGDDIRAEAASLHSIEEGVKSALQGILDPRNKENIGRELLRLKEGFAKQNVDLRIGLQPNTSNPDTLTLAVHKPGEPIGVEIKAHAYLDSQKGLQIESSSTAYDWESKQDTSMEPVAALADLRSGRSRDDSEITMDCANLVKNINSLDPFNAMMGPTGESLKELAMNFSSAFKEGYGGYTGYKATENLANDICRQLAEKHSAYTLEVEPGSTKASKYLSFTLKSTNGSNERISTGFAMDEGDK